MRGKNFCCNFHNNLCMTIVGTMVHSTRSIRQSLLIFLVVSVCWSVMHLLTLVRRFLAYHVSHSICLYVVRLFQQFCLVVCDCWEVVFHEKLRAWHSMSSRHVFIQCPQCTSFLVGKNYTKSSGLQVIGNTFLLSSNRMLPNFLLHHFVAFSL